MVCTGHMAGKGTLEASWSDDTHSTAQNALYGTMRWDPTPRRRRVDRRKHSAFKSPDCGKVKPITAN